MKKDGALVEEVYRVGGLYDREIREIVKHLTAAVPFATEPMARALRALITFYETGETADRVAYDIAWVEDRDSPVDTINGFVEVYMDARGVKGAWEALVYYVNPHKTKGIRKLADAAQWFEDRMPWADKYKKQGVRGISANAIDVVVETGDSGPVTPVGINLPNDQTIREHHGSKSVSLSNANQAYDKSTLPEFRREFAWSPEEAARAEKWSSIASELTTDMHEVIGHGSGRIAEHLQGNPQGVLKEQYSALEESRADLVALYFVPDRKLVELGLVDEADHDDIVRAEYEGYARNALVQLRRVREGTQIEEDHMRNRQMIVSWLIANSTAIEVRRRDDKTYYVVLDVKAFQEAVRPPPRGSAANQGGRGLPGGEGSVRDLRRPFRPGAQGRSGRARGPAADALLHRLRPAETRSDPGRPRRSRRRQDLVSAGPDDADVGVFGPAVSRPMKSISVLAAIVTIGLLQQAGPRGGNDGRPAAAAGPADRRRADRGSATRESVGRRRAAHAAGDVEGRRQACPRGRSPRARAPRGSARSFRNCIRLPSEAASPGAKADAIAQSLQGFDPAAGSRARSPGRHQDGRRGLGHDRQRRDAGPGAARWRSRFRGSATQRRRRSSAAEMLLRRIMTFTSGDPRRQGAYVAAARSFESLARINQRVTPLQEESVERLKKVVARSGTNDTE